MAHLLRIEQIEEFRITLTTVQHGMVPKWNNTTGKFDWVNIYDIVAPGANENVLVSNGTIWTSGSVPGRHLPVTLATNHGLSLSDQTLALGTPSTITETSTNSVSTTTHTHAMTPGLGFIGNGSAANQVLITGSTPFTPTWVNANNLTSLNALSFVSTSFVKMTAANTFGLDTNVYVIKSGDTGLGNMTFANNSVIDVASSGGSDVLNIGTGNADIVNIGYSGSTVNINGTLSYQAVDNLTVKDKLITLNKGGGVDSGVSSGFEVEENSIIKGWFTTNAGRTGFELRAPATNYSAIFLLSSLSTERTYTFPNASGTVALTSNLHNAVTLATNSGLQLSTQILNMGTPSSITTTSTNSVTTNTHTHAITGFSVSDHNHSGVYVPYTGATGVVNLGAYDLTVNGLTIGLGANSRSNNTVIGISGLSSNITGYNNNAIGAYVLRYNTDGNFNNAIGISALYSNTVGSYNTSIGSYSLYSNVANSRSTAIGYNTMYYADNRITGRDTYNTAIGYEALKGSATPANNTGQYNTAVGDQAMLGNTSGSDNIAIGYNTLLLNTTGYRNHAIGNYVLSSNTIGHENVAIGYYALSLNTTGLSNVAVGDHVLFSNTTGYENVGVGYYAILGNTIGFSNVALGNYALRFNTTANSNVAVGNASLRNTTTGSFNTAVGSDALYSNVRKIGSVAVGYQSMYYADNTTSSVNTYNTAIGYQALMGSSTPANNTGQYNTTVGNGSMYANTSGTGNTASGYYSLYSNTIGNYNVASGQFAMRLNTGGDSNTGIGNGALYSNTTADNNTAVGHSALYYNTIGHENVAVGQIAGGFITDGVTYNTVSNTSVYIGYATRAKVDGGVNEIVIGANTIGNGSNTATWGNTSITNHYFAGSSAFTTSVITPTISGSITTAGNLSIRANTADLTTGQVNITTSLEASSTTAAALTTAGGLGVAKRLWTTDLTSTNLPTLGGVALTTIVTKLNYLTDITGITGTSTGKVVLDTAPTFVTSLTTPSVLATANDSGALGASGTAFSDLFLASGGVINWSAGNATLTHSTGLLTSNVSIVTPTESYIGPSSTTGIYFKGGNVGIGTTAPNAKQENLSTTEQLRLSYDATHFSSFIVNATGDLTLVGGTTAKLTATTFVGTLTGTASKATNLVGGNSTTLLGSMPYQSNIDVTTMITPNITTTKKWLNQTGTGTNGAAPTWSALSMSDISLLNDTWITSFDYAGNSTNLMKLSKDNLIEFAQPVGLNAFYHVLNSGFNDIVNIPVDITSPDNTQHGVGITIGGQRLFSISALATATTALVDTYLINTSAAIVSTSSITATTLSLGDSTDTQKLWIYKSGNTRAGLGITGGSNLTIFTAQTTGIDFGYISTADGTTYTSLANISTTGEFVCSQYRLSSLNTAPTHAGDTGVRGEIRWSDGFVHLCIATNTWIRAALTTWTTTTTTTSTTSTSTTTTTTTV